MDRVFAGRAGRFGFPAVFFMWSAGVSMRKRAMFLLAMFPLLAGGGLPLAAPPSRGGIDVEPDGLKHYAYCVSQAKDRNEIYDLDRQILYRCHGEAAISYFNYLGRRRVPDRVAMEITGVFIYRAISGVGKCWNKISDAAGFPESSYGCDIYVDL
jgi:hypothetical protein